MENLADLVLFQIGEVEKTYPEEWFVYPLVIEHSWKNGQYV